MVVLQLSSFSMQVSDSHFRSFLIIVFSRGEKLPVESDNLEQLSVSSCFCTRELLGAIGVSVLGTK